MIYENTKLPSWFAIPTCLIFMFTYLSHLPVVGWLVLTACLRMFLILSETFLVTYLCPYIHAYTALLMLYCILFWLQITKKWEYALSKEIPQDLNSVSTCWLSRNAVHLYLVMFALMVPLYA